MCQGKTTWARSLSMRLSATLMPRSCQRIDLFQERRRIEHHAGTDDVHHVRIEDAAGNMVQLVGLVADHHRMPGVGSPLVTDDDIKLGSEQIDEFPLRFVPPLQTDDASTWHARVLPQLVEMTHSKPVILPASRPVW